MQHYIFSNIIFSEFLVQTLTFLLEIKNPFLRYVSRICNVSLITSDLSTLLFSLDLLSVDQMRNRRDRLVRACATIRISE